MEKEPFLTTSPPPLKRQSRKKQFSWDTAPALPHLSYESCHGDFQCARLELPMDYWNGTTNDTIGLAVIRRPAAVPVTDPRYGGAVLLNPGGPGGSGIGMALGAGGKIQKFIDSQDGKFFDIVSFDPRGVGASSPQMRCVKDDCEAKSWLLRVREEGTLGSSDASIGRLWSMMGAYGLSCSILPDGKADVRQYITTASVARDMVSLIEAHGAWREQEAARLLGKGCACSRARKNDMPCAEVPEMVRYVKGEEKIQYWGFSYGTYLGLTYAAMFPDKIHRLVVDGVVDAYDYRQTLWFDNLVDTERDMGLLYYHCARVGYPTCTLANETGKTTEEGVKARFANILESLYHNPLPVVQECHPEVISYSDVRSLIMASLYSPVQAFPFVANMLASIEKGDAVWFANFLLDYYKFTCPGCSNTPSISDALRNKTSDTTQLSPDAGMGIACTDGEDQSFLDRPLFEEHIKNLTKLSPTIGPEWAMIRLACAHYNVRPYHRFTAPWEAKTSHPVLLLGNTADPVTPLRAAKKMSKGFEDAVVLTQDSPGHCTLASVSKCTVGYVRKYFQTGELPPVNTTCKVDEVPFGSGPDEVSGVMDDETRQLSEDVASVQAALYQAGGAFMRPNKGLEHG
ncbi:hypothetical protein M409DRAFT_62985 [Zasmidium cellare ATCC 36951]|uniref:Peptidase S33 tripeptidyl aminopeptidase-like C-terminal domain-containing protein n=1 Tax=Zasmidium cellare ATCC 36951 TaxID=1080233 RepID=A0A6A6D1B4_ZASCE|nr:uncharacterized protein M409DRAFT_62985 [Zasmidium cellare ATCC 36951]KAF2172230.1 hypothetical protein M409DRAFT_62985 [Zasmidium cellare ATCC 36951]